MINIVKLNDNSIGPPHGPLNGSLAYPAEFLLHGENPEEFNPIMNESDENDVSPLVPYPITPENSNSMMPIFDDEEEIPEEGSLNKLD